MNLRQITTAAAISLLSSSLAFATPAQDDSIHVRASFYSSTYSDMHQKLISEVINTLITDKKLAGQLEIDGRNGSIYISGRVKEVSMIYRVVEIIKRNTDVRHVDVRQLDT
ncbi:hypothetical protein [Zhongshania aquimaris]|uniref:BON domain-containing protein n=1 Tax=Zhongshania aquimaris TaxID=2857107 RepID=A0ABS6VWW0_9GAMM|nr:hypothetical protein [Zhongshania aquimaris]MBW2942844.1 hypothetical protein [Zhongshania aquimaris]